MDLLKPADDVKGKVGLDAQVRYVFGGPEDKCGGGILQSKGHVKVLDRILARGQHVLIHHVARIAHFKEAAGSLIEDKLRAHAAVGAA